MKLTCEQMDVLISFYIKNELSKNLKVGVEEHLNSCFACKTKYEIIKTLSGEFSKKTSRTEEFVYSPVQKQDEENQQYKTFKKNLSAYIDNELSEKDSIKMKKIVINNKTARKDLEDSYRLKHLINESAQKTKNYIKQDFSKKVLEQLNPVKEQHKICSDTMKLVAGFLTSVLIISAIVLINLNL